jgi:hypothetical protein
VNSANGDMNSEVIKPCIAAQPSAQWDRIKPLKGSDRAPRRRKSSTELEDCVDYVVSQPRHNARQETYSVTLIGTHANAAVQTRAQAGDNWVLRPLHLSKIDALNIGAEQFKKLQREDPELKKYWEMAEASLNGQGDRADFVVKGDVLYRIYKTGPDKDPVKQVVVPEPLCDKAIAYAHESAIWTHGNCKNYLEVNAGILFPWHF